MCMSKRKEPKMDEEIEPTTGKRGNRPREWSQKQMLCVILIFF